MSSSEYKEARWQEVLDGQTMWEQHKVCPGDDDKFRTEYVDPLKALQTEVSRRFDKIALYAKDRVPAVVLR